MTTRGFFLARRIGVALMTVGLAAAIATALAGVTNLAALLAIGAGALLTTIHPDRSTK